MGKFSVKKDKGVDDDAEPKLVNKVEHNSSFKDADKAKAAANGEANGKTRKESSSSSSSSSAAGEADDKVGQFLLPRTFFMYMPGLWSTPLCVLDEGLDALNCSKKMCEHMCLSTNDVLFATTGLGLSGAGNMSDLPARKTVPLLFLPSQNFTLG